MHARKHPLCRWGASCCRPSARAQRHGVRAAPRWYLHARTRAGLTALRRAARSAGSKASAVNASGSSSLRAVVNASAPPGCRCFAAASVLVSSAATCARCREGVAGGAHARGAGSAGTASCASAVPQVQCFAIHTRVAPHLLHVGTGCRQAAEHCADLVTQRRRCRRRGGGRRDGRGHGHAVGRRGRSCGGRRGRASRRGAGAVHHQAAASDALREQPAGQRPRGLEMPSADEAFAGTGTRSRSPRRARTL